MGDVSDQIVTLPLKSKIANLTNGRRQRSNSHVNNENQHNVVFSSPEIGELLVYPWSGVRRPSVEPTWIGGTRVCS